MKIDFISKSNKISEKELFWILGILTACFLFMFIIQALYVPFWQDDYYYLVNAQNARLEGDSWFAPFLPEVKYYSWRPLSVELYWRFVETVFGGNVQVAHLTNLLLHILSVLAVGWFSITLLKLLAPEKNHFFAGALVAFLYGIHAAHILPVIWVSAVNSSITILFAALTLRFWLKALTAETNNKETFALILVFICFALALLSKEISIVLPALGFLLTIFIWPQTKPSKKAWAVSIHCVIFALGWLILRESVTSAPHPAYELKFGDNIIRNTVSLTLFFFNAPREALRFLVIDASVGAGIWGFLCFALQFASFILFFYGAWEKLKTKRMVILFAFFAVGCAPYFFLSWNCYAYYIVIGLFVYAIIIALSAHRTKIVLMASSLAVLSSVISWSGNYLLDYPALIARAFWAEEQLSKIEKTCESRPELCSGKLYLDIENEHKFLGFGIPGLVYRIGLSENDIVVLNHESEIRITQPVLVVPSQGDVYFRH